MSQSGDVFTIPDPNLKMEELEQVQIEVATLLEHGLPVEGKPWPPNQSQVEQTPKPPPAIPLEDTEAPESEPTPAAEQVA